MPGTPSQVEAAVQVYNAHQYDPATGECKCGESFDDEYDYQTHRMERAFAGAEFVPERRKRPANVAVEPVRYDKSTGFPVGIYAPDDDRIGLDQRWLAKTVGRTLPSGKGSALEFVLPDQRKMQSIDRLIQSGQRFVRLIQETQEVQAPGLGIFGLDLDTADEGRARLTQRMREKYINQGVQETTDWAGEYMRAKGVPGAFLVAFERDLEDWRLAR